MTTAAERKEIRDALATIAEANGGRLTPDAVVSEAASKSSVLHDLFEWDTRKAAHAYRLDQARTLIRSVRVVITNERTTVSTVCYVRDPDATAEDQGYVATASIIGDVERARATLVNEFSRAAGALRRARELAVAFDMVGEVDAIAVSVDAMRTKVEAKVEQQKAA